MTYYFFDGIEDTREWTQDSPYSKPRPVKGSGIVHNCDHCGAEHEVHVFLREGTRHGKQLNVGTTCVSTLAPWLGSHVSTRELYRLHAQKIREEQSRMPV